MIYYHGSNIAGIETLRPMSHDMVFLTHSKVLATIYSQNPLTRPNGFFSYWWSKEGKLYYDEYFEDQLRSIYSGKRGYVYSCEGDFTQNEKMPWIYTSTEQVPVKQCEEIPDIYLKLLEYEQQGLLTIQRYNEVSQKQRDVWENVVRNSLKSSNLTTALGKEYYDYVKEHFKNID